MLAGAHQSEALINVHNANRELLGLFPNIWQAWKSVLAYYLGYSYNACQSLPGWGTYRCTALSESSKPFSEILDKSE